MPRQGRDAGYGSSHNRVWYAWSYEGQAVHEYVAGAQGYPAQWSTNKDIPLLERFIPTRRHREAWRKACWERLRLMPSLPAELDIGWHVGENYTAYILHYGFPIGNEAISAYVRRLWGNDSYPPENFSHGVRAALREVLSTRTVPEQYRVATNFALVIAETGCVRWLVALYNDALFRARSAGQARLSAGSSMRSSGISGPLMWFYDVKHLPKRGELPPSPEHAGMCILGFLHSMAAK
ncbi:hypothetical protein BV20DRAFT_960715 [Pilatotrama ljubarskyi]|nr:hypothetical protein BV20DRAFT_960715 [Pilatotrama ljubarskyi]